MMPGQGYHYTVGKLVFAAMGKDFTDKAKVGILLPDTLTEQRRLSHFCSGGMVEYPTPSKLKTADTKASDDEIESSYVVDPMIDIVSFLRKNATRLKDEGDYLEGILIYLITDSMYDRMMRCELFDFRLQTNNAVIVRQKDKI